MTMEVLAVRDAELKNTTKARRLFSTDFNHMQFLSYPFLNSQKLNIYTFQTLTPDFLPKSSTSLVARVKYLHHFEREQRRHLLVGLDGVEELGLCHFPVLVGVHLFKGRKGHAGLVLARLLVVVAQELEDVFDDLLQLTGGAIQTSMGRHQEITSHSQLRNLICWVGICGAGLGEILCSPLTMWPEKCKFAL